MEQATEPTTTTAPREPHYAGDDTFIHAAAVAASVVDPLAPGTRPSSVRIEPSLPSGWAVTICFLSHHAAGLYEVAANIDVPITRAFRGEEIHLEAYASLHNVDIRSFVLVTPTQAAELEGEHAPTRPAPAAQAAQADVEAPAVVPLGVGVLAQVPAVTPVEPTNTEALDGGQ